MAGLTPMRRLLKKIHPEGIPGPGATIYNAVTSSEIFQRQYALIATDILDRCDRGALLDVGTGPAWLLLRLHERRPEMALTGLDASAAMVASARRNIAAVGLAGQIEIHEGNVRRMPFADQQFDIVVSTGSIHHWKQPTAGLDEVHRVLKEGGYALIYDVVSDTPWPVLQAAGREFGRLKTALFWLHGFEEPFYSQAAVEALARPTRFREGHTHYVGILCSLTLQKARGHSSSETEGCWPCA